MVVWCSTFVYITILVASFFFMIACEREEAFHTESEQNTQTILSLREEVEFFDLIMLQKIHDAFVTKVESMQDEGPFTNDNANGLLSQMDILQKAIDKEDVEKGNRILENVILTHLQSLFDDGLFEGYEEDYEDLVNIARGILCPCFSEADLYALDWRNITGPYYSTALLFFRWGSNGELLQLTFKQIDENTGEVTRGILHEIAMIKPHGSEDQYYGFFRANTEIVFDGILTEDEYNSCYAIFYELTRELKVGDFAR